MCGVAEPCSWPPSTGGTVDVDHVPGAVAGEQSTPG